LLLQHQHGEFEVIRIVFHNEYQLFIHGCLAYIVISFVKKFAFLSYYYRRLIFWHSNNPNHIKRQKRQ
jgi:hypothetical protein